MSSNLRGSVDDHTHDAQVTEGLAGLKESQADVPVDAPEHCPGTASDLAGKATPCQGCPNQRICASGAAKGVDPAIEEIRERMAGVKHKILVLSGKGGVGKSTFSALLARAISFENPDTQVALLDIDICGPSQPRMMGVEFGQIHQSASGWSPVFVDENLCLVSIGFLLEGPDDAVVWRGPRKNGIIKQFLKDVDWGDIDYLIIDTPPGTSDEHLSIVSYLSAVHVDGALLVTTPQDVAILDVRKEVSFCRKVKLPIIGVAENMTEFVCPKCQKPSVIFPPTSGGAAGMCKELGLDLLARIPLDPRVGRCCDEGRNLFAEFPESVATKAFQALATKLRSLCEKI